MNGRLLWRDFIGTDAWKAVQKALRQHGYHLVVNLDENKVATDAFVKQKAATSLRPRD